MIHAAVVVAALLTLIPFLAAAFFPSYLSGVSRTWPTWVRLVQPAVLCVPYLLVAGSTGTFHWDWLALYGLVPVVVALLLWQAGRGDPERRGDWVGFLVF